MNDVITATGKKFKTDYLVTIPKPKMLYVRLLDVSEETARAVFENPEETAELRCREMTFTGYSNLRSISDEGDALKVGLENAINNNTES